MLLKNVEQFKVSTTNQAMTSFAGVPLVLGTALTVLDFHRQRQDESENTNKEVIATGLAKLPCADVSANAVFFQIVLLTAVVIAALK